MKIAMIGSFTYRYPLAPGKIHTPLFLTYQLAEGLAKLGHDVTFFSLSDDSFKKEPHAVKLEDFGCQGLPEQLLDRTKSTYQRLKILYEQGFASRVFSLKEDFDIYYTWGAYFISPFAKFTDKPVVVSHHDSNGLENYSEIYKANSSENFFMIPISESMKKKLWFNPKNTLEVVHNGFDKNKIKFVPESEDYFCWAGRIVPSKGLHIALDICEKLGLKLKIAGPFGPFSDFPDSQDYSSKIESRIGANKNFEYVGVLNQQQAYDFLGHAKALIFPTNGNEGLPSIPIEAMMGGTPTVTFDRGPMNEIVDGKNGYLCDSEEDMVMAMAKVDRIDREYCREFAERNFSLESMAKNYERAFKDVLASRMAHR